jgi:hypothetical protein
MKTLAILFTLFYFFNALAVAPYGFKGQQQSQTLYSNVLQAQNNLVTNMGGINALLETGNKNILINPSFEHATFSTGWTNSAGTFTQDTVVEIDGLKAAKLVLSSQTMSLSQSSTLYASQFADGVQGLASVRVKSDVALKVCSVQAGTVSTTNCVDVVANNKWGLYKVPMILGATSNGISIASTGAVTGTVYIDDAFVGAVDLQATVDASKIAGEAYFAGTASCQWTRTSTTVGAFTATAACPGPTIVEQNMGSWQTTDSDLPRVTVNNLPAGKYKAKFFVGLLTSNGNTAAISISDGLTSCEPVYTNPTTTTMGTFIECSFTYNQSGNRSFELFGASTANSVSINNAQNANPRASAKFILEYFGSSSVYSSTNADTDWASCGHTTSSFTGLGTVTNINTQCKRQGGDLLMKGSFTVGTVTAVEARLSLPLWNGVQLTSSGSSIIPSIQKSGELARGPSESADNFHILIEPSVNYFTFSRGASAASGLSKIQGTSFTASDTLSFMSRIPIEGWQQSNIIIGQFNGLESCTNTLECTDTFSARISSAGVVSGENVDWISGNCSGSGSYSCTFNTSIFTVAPNCSATTSTNTTFGLSDMSPTSTGVTYQGRNTATGAIAAGGVNIICQKQGVDYVGKTAKSVASDQSLRVPGTTNYVTYTSTLNCSATSSITGQDGAWVSSVGNISAGACSINLASNKFLNNNYRCSLALIDSVTTPLAAPRISAKTTSAITMSCSANSGGSTVACTNYTVDLSCTGQVQ